MPAVKPVSRSRRGLLAGALAVSALLALTGCVSGSPTPEDTSASDGGAELEQIVLATKMSELADLHPQSARASRALALLNHVSEGLTKFNPDFTVGPGLAEDWTISGDGLTYTFTLRQGVTWHDGEPMSADDVEFTFDTLMAEDSLSTAKGILTENVESIDVSDTEAIFTLRQPYAPFLSVLAGQAAILPEHLLAPDPNAAEFVSTPVGTGPYKVAARDLSTITLEANADYWGAKPNIGTIILFDSPDPAAQFASMITGEVDVVEYEPNAMADLMNQGAQLWTGAAGSVHGINRLFAVEGVVRR